MGSFPQSIVHYLPVTDHDERWGIVCTTAGYQNVPPGSPYPLTQHPDSYSFTRSRSHNRYSDGGGSSTSSRDRANSARPPRPPRP